MNVLFLLTNYSLNISYHPGISSISSFLKEDGFTTSLLIVNESNELSLPRKLKEFSPSVVVATSNSHQYPHVKHLIETIKSTAPDIRVILGGCHSTLYPDLIESIDCLDAACRGEGEEAALAYCRCIRDGKIPSGIPNLCLRHKDGSIEHNEITSYIKDLDNLPFPDYSMFPEYRDGGGDHLRARVMFNRGCPFDCSYCCNHRFKAVFPDKGKYVRFMSAQRAVDIIKWLAENYRFKEYVVDDDIFTLRKDWLLEFCRLYPEGLAKEKTFEINARIGTLDEEMLDALKNIGCTLIKIGLESGSEDLRKKVLNRNISDEDTYAVAKMVKDRGLRLFTFNMVGLPGETLADAIKTIRMNRNMRVDRAQITGFYPYENTRLGEMCFNEDRVGTQKQDTYFSGSILKRQKGEISKFAISHILTFFQFYLYAGIDNRRAFIGLARGVKRTCKKLLGLMKACVKL